MVKKTIRSEWFFFHTPCISYIIYIGAGQWAGLGAGLGPGCGWAVGGAVGWAASWVAGWPVGCTVGWVVGGAGLAPRLAWAVAGLWLPSLGLAGLGSGLGWPGLWLAYGL